MKRESPQERWLSDLLISASRSAWYSATEPLRLRLARRHDKRRFDTLEPGLSDWHWREYDSLVTVYIPTFNRVELLLERALPSVLAQTYRNIEIIVAAHGCTDDTDYKAAQFMRAKRWPESRMYFCTVPRTRTYPPTAENHWLAGPVVPANAALKAARGAWIARIDDDDTWTSNHIERLLRFAQEGDYEFVSSAYLRGEDGIAKIVPHDKGSPPIGGTQTWLYRSYLRFMRYNPDCWRKRWNRVNDTDLADRFRKAGVRIGWLNEVLAHVMPRPGETTIGIEAYRRDAKAKEAHFAF